MATVNPTSNDPVGKKDGSLRLITFETMTTTNTTTAVIDWAEYADRSVQVAGTFGAGGTLLIEGSNDGTNWATLNNVQGTALSITAAGIKQVAEVTTQVRARVSAGDGTTSLNVAFLLRRANPMRT